MPNNVSLPEVARANMSQRAGERISEKAPHVAPFPTVNLITSTAADETLVATNGADVFVFDAANSQGTDVIIGYDPATDRIEFRNVDSFGAIPAFGTETVFRYGGAAVGMGGEVTVDESPQSLLQSDTVSIFYWWGGPPDIL